MRTKMDVIVDLQFGSTGKGALAGWLSEKRKYYASVSANGPNAGHTAYSPDTDQKFIHKVLPSGIFSPNLDYLGVGPGAIFDMDRLCEEWKGVRAYRNDVLLLVHEAAGILLPEHREAEKATLSRISSTMQGSAEAMIARIRRQEGAIARYHKEQIENLGYGIKVVTNIEWLELLGQLPSILVEGSQGFSLGISAGFYPYCTSRDCTPARVIADCGLPLPWLREVYGSARVHPIRVGNTPDGYSGDWYPDQHEISFESLGVTPETTTVTGRVRRIATFSEQQIYEAIAAARPDKVFLNFYQYDQENSDEAVEAIDGNSFNFGLEGVTLIGIGPRPSDIKEVG